jgi:lipoate---protein ligase
MQYLKIPSKRPLYRGERSHVEFLTKLKDFVKDRSELEEAITESLKAQFEVETIDIEKFMGILFLHLFTPFITP